MQTNNNLKATNQHKDRIKIVSGKDYDNPQGWQTLYRMVERHVDKKYPNQYDAQWLNWMIRMGEQPNGFTTGVEYQGKLQCLLIAEWHYNMWINAKDANIMGMLTAPGCKPRWVDLMLHQVTWWAQESDCQSINIFTWDDRRAYQRWCSKKGFKLYQYTYSKELK